MVVKETYYTVEIKNPYCSKGNYLWKHDGLKGKKDDDEEHERHERHEHQERMRRRMGRK